LQTNLRQLNRHTPHHNNKQPGLQIRRLNNSAKRIVISNVYTSINNQSILNQLRVLNIIPVSQTSHLKAGISEEGYYDHILSFRRQMYLHKIRRHSKNTKLTINQCKQLPISNIFRLRKNNTCFIWKSTGHTSLTCKKAMVNNKEISTTPHQTNVIEINSTSENQKINLIENSQPPNNSPMFITLDESPTNWNVTTESSTHKPPPKPPTAHYTQLPKSHLS